MEPRGGTPYDTDASRRRGHTLEHLREDLQGIDFPISKRDLLAKKGDRELALGDTGQTVKLRDILANTNATEFTSPRHVTDLIDMDWTDMSDILDPGGTGTSEPWGIREEMREE